MADPQGREQEAGDARAPENPAASPVRPPAKSKKTPKQKRADTEAKRKEWTQEEIDAAILANGGTPKAPTEETRSPGRPSKYPTIDLERVEMYAAGGLTKAEIAASVGIAIDTLMEYQKAFPDFSAAIDRGRSIRLERAEMSLHMSGAGHYAPEEKLHYDAMVGKWVREQTLKYYPPDTKANLAILLHGETKSWKPKAEMDHHFPEPLVLKSKTSGQELESLGTEKAT